MSQPLPGSPQDEMSDFTILVLHYLDGECSAQEVAQLKDALVANAACREVFVQVCRVHGDLHEVFSAKESPVAVGASLAAVGAGQQAVVRPARPEAAEEVGGEEEPTKILPLDDPGADTVIRGSSREDTINREPKPPDK